MNEIIESIDTYSNKKIDYIINLPNCYYDNSNKLYPLILFLHGAGERGNDISDVKKYGIHKYLNNKKLPFIILSPQCKANNFWDAHLNDIELLLDKIKIKYHVDCNKICGWYKSWCIWSLEFCNAKTKFI